MEENNDFFADFNVSLPGQRPVSNVPELRVLSTFNRLELNNAAAEMMGVKVDDTVLVIDNAAEKEDVNAIYYIIKHSTLGSTLSSIGSKLAFSYSGYYVGMILGNPATHKGGKLDLKTADALVEGAATTSTKFNVSYKVIDTGRTYVYSGEECQVFALEAREQHDVQRRNTSTIEVNSPTGAGDSDNDMDMDMGE